MEQERDPRGGPAVPRLYVVPASPLEVGPPRESIFSCARRRWIPGVIGLLAGLAIGLALVGARGERAAYAQLLSLGEVARKPVQNLASAREALLEQLRARRDPPLPALATATELIPVTATDPARSRQLWMRVLAPPDRADEVDEAFAAVTEVAAASQARDYAASFEQASRKLQADRLAAARATAVLDLALRNETLEDTGADQLVLMEYGVRIAEIDLASSSEVARVGAVLETPVALSGLRSAAMVAVPAILLGVVSIAPWSRRPRGATG